jgi:hypothetical protein
MTGFAVCDIGFIIWEQTRKLIGRARRTPDRLGS